MIIYITYKQINMNLIIQWGGIFEKHLGNHYLWFKHHFWNYSGEAFSTFVFYLSLKPQILPQCLTIWSFLVKGKRSKLESTCQRAEASVKGWQQRHPCESWLSGRWLLAQTENFPPFVWEPACDGILCSRFPTAKKKKPNKTMSCYFPSAWTAWVVYGQHMAGDQWIRNNVKKVIDSTHDLSCSGGLLINWAFILKSI